MVSIAWALSKLRFPLKPELGGVSPGYIDGLSFRWVASDQIVVDSGAAWCPYTTNPHVVVLAAPLTLNVPGDASTVRSHLWLHDDNGTPTVAIDNTALTSNYFGQATNHVTNKGWRYLGSLLRNTQGNVFQQSAEDGVHSFFTHVAQQPFEFLSTAAQTAARAVNLNGLIPPTATSIIAQYTASAAVLRLCASTLVTNGNTPQAGWFTFLVLAGQSMVIELPVGKDGGMQYASDAATGTLTARATGYRFKR